MKILYLITGLGGGGAEKVVADLADQMAKIGHQVKIAYLKGGVIVRPENGKIDLVYLGLETLKNSKIAYKNYKLLIQEFQPDVVHAHMVHANIFARISRIFTPVPKLICTAHSNNEGGTGRMLAYRLTHHLADLTTNVSESAAKSFENFGAVPKKGIKAVFNGIDLNKFKKNEELRNQYREDLKFSKEDTIILAVGRFHAAKNYPSLIHAFKLLKMNSGTDFTKLVIAGDGEGRTEIENLITKLELNDSVILLGRREDIAILMSAVDIFVLASIYEGFGLVVAEAMASECYVVATNCGGVKEVMGGHGSLVIPNNSEALARELFNVLKLSMVKKDKNNKQALKYIQENFSLDKIVQQWLIIYEGQ